MRPPCLRNGALVCVATVLLAGVVAEERSAPQPATTAPIEATLDGFVFDADGEPLPGAVVRFMIAVAPLAGKADASPVESVETDETGAFRFEVGAGHAVALHVSAENHAAEMREGVAPGTTLEVRLSRGRTLSGELRDQASEEPLAGATVRLLDSKARRFGAEVVPETTTNDEGRYRFDHQSLNDGVISGVAPGHALSRLAYGRADNAETVELHVLRLSPGARIAGVVRQANGAPIPQARVTAIDAEFAGPGQPTQSEVESSTDGRFDFEGIPAPARYRLVVRAEGFTDAQAQVIGVAPGRDADDVEIVLSRGAELTFRLVDERDEPVAATAVHLRSETDRGFGALERGGFQSYSGDRLKEEADNRVRVQQIPQGTYTVTLHPETGRILSREGVVFKEDREVDLGRLVVEPGNVVTGGVFDGSGDAVSGATISAVWTVGTRRYRRRSTSDETGAFRITGLEESSVRVEVKADGFAPGRQDAVEPGTTDLDFRLERFGSVSGAVLIEGTPPAQFEVKLFRKTQGFDPSRALDRPARSRTVRLPDTSFEVADVAPGEYTVEVVAAGFKPARVQALRVDADRDTAAPALTLERGLELHGRVVRLTDGMPVRDARISLREGAGNAMMSAFVAPLATRGANEEGAFVFVGLEPGRYELRADHREYAAGSLPVTLSEDAPAEPTVISLSSGGEITGTVRGRDGHPVIDSDIMLFEGMGANPQRTSTDGEGVYRFRHLTPGGYDLARNTVGARSPMDLDVRPAEVTEGEVTVIDFDEREPIAVSGQVLRGDDTVPGVRLTFIGMAAAPRIVSTDADELGRYELEVDRPGGYTVTVVSARSGGVLGSSTLEIPDEPQVVRNISLAAGSIGGRVIDDTGDAVPHARVTAVSAVGIGPSRMPMSDMTRDDGTFHVGGLDEGQYRLVAAAESYGTATTETLALRVDTPITDVEIVLGSGRKLRGRVVDPGGQPVAGAMIQELVGGGPGSMRLAGPDGGFELTLPVTGSVDLWYAAAGWAPGMRRGLTADLPTDEVIELMLTHGGQVRAVVRDVDGAPLGGVRVELSSRESLGGSLGMPPATAGDGSILLENVSPGVYTVSAPGGTPIEAVVREGETTELELVGAKP